MTAEWLRTHRAGEVCNLKTLVGMPGDPHLSSKMSRGNMVGWPVLGRAALKYGSTGKTVRHGCTLGGRWLTGSQGPRANLREEDGVLETSGTSESAGDQQSRVWGRHCPVLSLEAGTDNPLPDRRVVRCTYWRRNSPLARNPAILCPIPSRVTFTKSDSLQRRPSPCPTWPEMSLLSWSPELRPPLAIWLRQSEHTASQPGHPSLDCHVLPLGNYLHFPDNLSFLPHFSGTFICQLLFLLRSWLPNPLSQTELPSVCMCMFTMCV